MFSVRSIIPETPNLKIQNPDSSIVSTNLEQILSCLRIESGKAAGQRLLESGCGKAEVSVNLAKQFPDLEIIATEVDQLQHQKNLAMPDPPANIRFCSGGAEKIDAPDRSFNYVLMLKSLHHVPAELTRQALTEIRRVLQPGGLALFLEPVFAGDFNEVFRLFNDEQIVRQAAFDALKLAVGSGQFVLVKQIFLNVRRAFTNFAEFETQIIHVTHSNFAVSDSQLAEIRNKFESFANADGSATFLMPQRIDLLKRTA